MAKNQLGQTNIFLGPFSIGTSPLGNVFGEVPIQDAEQMCHEIIQQDKFLFDTSPFYGILKSEKVLGHCLKGVPRDKYYLSSKVGRFGQEEFDFSAKRIKQSVNESLVRLGVDYLDILILHDVEYVAPDRVLHEALPALQQIKQSGKTRYIGFSCEPLCVIKFIIEQSPVKLDVILSYKHYCLIDDTLSSLFPLLREKEIGLINASPFSLGLLTRSTPDWHPIPKEKLAECKALIKEVETEFNYSIERVALQFSLNEANVPTTLVGLKNLEQFRFLEQAVKDPIPSEIYAKIKSKMLNKITYECPYYTKLGVYSFLHESKH